MKNFLLTFFIATISVVAYAQWSDNPEENNRITPLATEIYDHELKVSGNGTSFVVFNRPTGGTTATYIQIVDINGNMLFPEQGKLISNKQTLSWTMTNELLFVDDDGNAIVVVSDCRNSAADDLSFTLYKVSPTGEMLWGNNGLDLCNGMAYDLVADMKIVQLEDGSYVCAWMVESSTLYIQLQRISKTGELLWNEAEARLYSSSTFYEYPYLVNAGTNQIIVVFSKGMMYNKTLKAQKFDINGSPVWANEMTVYSGGFGMAPLWVVVRVIPDQMGGAFVGWFDDRNYTNVESTYVVHVKANGTHGFASGENGEKVGYSPLRSFVPEMYFDKTESELYIAWRETNDTQSWQQMKGQKLKIPSGELLWGMNGIDVSPLTQSHSVAFHSIQNGGNGNVAVFFTSNTWHPEHDYGWDKQNITLINSHGEYVWDEEILQFSIPVGFKGSLLSTPLLFNNYWLTAWNDDRIIAGDPGGSKKIYMQRINKDGTLGNNGTIFCLPPTNLKAEMLVGGCSRALISWEGEADDYELSYRIVNKEWIFENVIGEHSFVLEDLAINTDYEVRVRSICTENDISEWSEVISFRTADHIVPCDVPENLKATEVTNKSAVLSWKEGYLGNVSWELRYSEASANVWNNIVDLVETSYFLDELKPNTAYLWTIRAFCPDPCGSVYSDWAPKNEFTTKPNNLNDLQKEAITVYASGKILNIINPKNSYIEVVQLFDITGKLLSEYKINGTDNVLIPTNLSSGEMIIFVRIIGQNDIENHKVLLK